jgi:hypothetical protein
MIAKMMQKHTGASQSMVVASQVFVPGMQQAASAQLPSETAEVLGRSIVHCNITGEHTTGCGSFFNKLT